MRSSRPARAARLRRPILRWCGPRKRRHRERSRTLPAQATPKASPSCSTSASTHRSRPGAPAPEGLAAPCGDLASAARNREAADRARRAVGAAERSPRDAALLRRACSPSIGMDARAQRGDGRSLARRRRRRARGRTADGLARARHAHREAPSRALKRLAPSGNLRNLLLSQARASATEFLDKIWTRSNFDANGQASKIPSLQWNLRE